MNRMLFCVSLCLLAVIAGCTGAQQRGMQGNAYVSTARPAISMQAVNMPLITAGEGSVKLDGTGVLGGLSLNAWLAVYGKGDAQSPLAIVAMAEVPSLHPEAAADIALMLAFLDTSARGLAR